MNNNFYFYPAKEPTINIFEKYGIYLDGKDLKKYNKEQLEKCDYLGIGYTKETKSWDEKIINNIELIGQIFDLSLGQLNNYYKKGNSRLDLAIEEHHNTYENNISIKDFIKKDFLIIDCIKSIKQDDFMYNRFSFLKEEKIAYNIYTPTIFDSFNLISYIKDDVNFTRTELSIFIQNKYGLDSYSVLEKNIPMPFNTDSRNQGGNQYVKNFINHMNSVFVNFENEFNTKISNLFYCYGELGGLRNKTLIGKTIIGFDDFIYNYAGNHTIFYGILVLENGLIIKINTNGTTYFDGYKIYTPNNS